MNIPSRAFLALALLGLVSGCPQGEVASIRATPTTRNAQVSPRLGAGGAKVKLVSWNVRDFFDTTDDPYQDEVPSQPRQLEKVRQMSRVLSEVDADFVALEEVENLDCLQQLNEALPRPYPQLGLIEGNDGIRGIDVAFLSRLPVSRVVSHREREMPRGKGVPRGYRFSRDCLEVGLATSPPATVFVNHLKAQVGNKKDSANKRRAQAVAVAEIVQGVAERYPDGFEVVLGDLNDEPKSWSLEPLFSTLHDPFEGWPKKVRTTHRSRHGGSTLDHILISHDASARAGEGRVWQDLGKGTSDHDPISLELRLDSPAMAPEPREWSQGDASGR